MAVSSTQTENENVYKMLPPHQNYGDFKLQQKATQLSRAPRVRWQLTRSGGGMNQTGGIRTFPDEWWKAETLLDLRHSRSS